MLLRRIAVFVGSFTLDAAEVVCSARGGGTGGLAEIDVLEGLGSLVDKSLLKRETGEDLIRFVLLGTIREYALVRLTESGEAEAVRQNHADFFLQLAQEAAPELQRTDQLIWLGRLKQELDNLRAALEWNKRRKREAAVRAATVLAIFWKMIGHQSEGREWLGGMLAQESEVSASAKAGALGWAAVFASEQGDYSEARQLAEAGLDLSRPLGDKRVSALSLWCLALSVYLAGGFEQAKDLWQESLTIFREVKDDWYTSNSLRLLGICMLHEGDYARATSLFEESLTTSRQMGDRWSIAYLLRNWGLAVLYQGQYERAAALCAESLPLSREFGDEQSVAWALEGLGAAAILGQGLSRRAARLFGAAEVLREHTGTPIPQSDRAFYDRSLQAIRARLEEKAFDTEWRIGRIMDLDQSVEYAMAQQFSI